MHCEIQSLSKTQLPIHTRLESGPFYVIWGEGDDELGVLPLRRPHQVLLPLFDVRHTAPTLMEAVERVRKTLTKWVQMVREACALQKHAPGTAPDTMVLPVRGGLNIFQEGGQWGCQIRCGLGAFNRGSPPIQTKFLFEAQVGQPEIESTPDEENCGVVAQQIGQYQFGIRGSARFPPE